MPQPIATIIRKTPIPNEENPDIIDHWNIETATARVGIVKPTYRLEGPDLNENPGGIELVREDTGETILCPFHEKSTWTILARVPDPETREDDEQTGNLEFQPFSTSGIMALKQLATEPENQDQARLWLTTIREWRDCILDLYQNVPDMVLPESVTTILSETYLDTVRPAELPPGITAAGLGRLVMANSLRVQIAALREEDAMAATGEWIGNMRDFYQPMPGSCFRSPLINKAYGENSVPESAGQHMAQINDGLVREVFAKVTSCLPENITAGMARRKSGDLIDRLHEAGALEITASGNSEWGQTVREHIQDVLDQHFDGHYQPDCRLFVTTSDQDVLVVGDQEGSYFYSWPSVSRAQIIDRRDGTPVVTTICEQIPSPEEVMALREELDHLLDLGDRQEPEPDQQEDHQPITPRMM